MRLIVARVSVENVRFDVGIGWHDGLAWRSLDKPCMLMTQKGLLGDCHFALMKGEVSCFV